MKKILIIFALSIFFNTLFVFGATGEIVIYKKVKTGEGTRHWNADPTYPCPLALGTDCSVQVKENKFCDIQQNSFGYIISIKINEIIYTNLTTNQIVKSQVSNSSLFSGEFTLRVENCNAYPLLNGITIDIPNVIIGNDNKFQILIPNI